MLQESAGESGLQQLDIFEQVENNLENLAQIGGNQRSSMLDLVGEKSVERINERVVQQLDRYEHFEFHFPAVLAVPRLSCTNLIRSWKAIGTKRSTIRTTSCCR